MIQVIGGYTGLLEAKRDRLFGKIAVVFFTTEPFLIGSGDEFAILD